MLGRANGVQLKRGRKDHMSKGNKEGGGVVKVMKGKSTEHLTRASGTSWNLNSQLGSLHRTKMGLLNVEWQL